MVPEAHEVRERAVRRLDLECFFRRRRQISLGLLVFVVGVGLPLIGVSPLRRRLSTRVMALKSAMAGDIKPATLGVGANHEPFPAEYQNPVPPAPSFAAFPQFKSKVLDAQSPGASAQNLIPSRPRHASKAGRIDFPPPPVNKSAESTEQTEGQTASSPEPELKYEKGKAEQDAYELLLKSNATVAGMVEGRNPALKFKSWDAANRGEDTYWVRLKFESAGNPDQEYIWVVKLQSNEVTPLSHNARSIS